MDTQSLRILYIIPGFDEGGAEVHVLNLIRELCMRHEITLVSSGGRLESQLPERVRVIHLPVDRKNLFTGIYSALKLSRLNKKFHWDIVHVHSRVPAWIAWILSGLTGIKFIATAHALYSLNAGLIPYRHCDGVICISEAVKTHMKEYLPDYNDPTPTDITLPPPSDQTSPPAPLLSRRGESASSESPLLRGDTGGSIKNWGFRGVINKRGDLGGSTVQPFPAFPYAINKPFPRLPLSGTEPKEEEKVAPAKGRFRGVINHRVQVIYNGITKSHLTHTYSGTMTKFLFTGRLTRLKGLDTALKALAELANYDWTLDIIGDGPQREELEALTRTLGINQRVIFHGHQDKSKVEEFMCKSSCLLFPSHSEGMGLVVLEAVSLGLPVIASDIEALHELGASELVEAGNFQSWKKAIKKFLDTGAASIFDESKIFYVYETAELTERFYRAINTDTINNSTL